MHSANNSRPDWRVVIVNSTHGACRRSKACSGGVQLRPADRGTKIAIVAHILLTFIIAIVQSNQCASKPVGAAKLLKLLHFNDDSVMLFSSSIV